jgi:branched-subunit amino acid transport protein
MTMATMVTVVAVLALGTYLLRITGVALAEQISLPEPLRKVLPLAAVALLAALAVTAALTEAGHAAGVARPAGVLVGVILAWRRLPFAVVVIAAAVTAAGLRLLGVP